MAERFFDKPDSPHGLAKRIILYRYLQGEFARAVNEQWRIENNYPTRRNHYHLTYFDAFSGTGRYKNLPEENNDDKEFIKECPFEDTSLGSPLVALEAIYKHTTEKKIYGQKNILLVFVEKDKTRSSMLKQNVHDYLHSKGEHSKYKEVRKDHIHVEITKTIFEPKTKKFRSNNISIDIKLYCCEFKHLNNEEIRTNSPMVSFFDPFGFSQIPMHKVIEYVGVRRSIICNLMVGPINRFAKTKRNKLNFNQLFGCNEFDNWQQYLPDNFKNLPVPSKMRLYSEIYRKCFTNMYNIVPDSTIPVKFLEFSMRKGTGDGVEKGFIYYLIFAALDLGTMSNIKYALHTAAQNFKLEGKPSVKSHELFFSDHHYESKIQWRPETSIEDQGNFIYDHMKGKTITFGKLKEWIILSSPYQVISTALTYLEKEGYIEVVSENYKRNHRVPEYKRQRMAFPRYVGTNYDDPDWDARRKIIYCNGWVIHFYENKIQKSNKGKKRKLSSDETPIKESDGLYKETPSQKPNRQLFPPEVIIID